MTALRTVAIRLKIPDNEAYTALTALRRLGVDVGRLERADVWQIRDDGDLEDFALRVEQNESLFNPNKHELQVLNADTPREGEVWIVELEAAEQPVRVKSASVGRCYTGWRLFSHGHDPADRATVQAAVERLLCNPAIERAIYDL